MKDAGKIGAMGVTEAEGRQEGAEDRTNEDSSWMVGEDPTFYLEDSDSSREKD